MQIDIKMNKIIIILLIIYTIDLCLNLFNFIKIKKWFAQPDNYLKKSNKTNLYILIPMMNEQVIAQETFKHFYNFCTEFTNYKVVYITTDRETKKTGKRVISVGTTSCRVLETIADEKTGMVAPTEGDTQIFIYPGYKFKCIDGLITNFHLPQSTLLMLVSALAGKEYIMGAYNEAVKEKYRFFSFGDAMFIK